ncbi:MAG TPA: hypothetical protein VNV42_15070 [Solirubrobacteraceae bacterium]|jgi:hypothetical protein|nr:hypothetical protein [Solirubrobacteraceae bacterium]
MIGRRSLRWLLGACLVIVGCASMPAAASAAFGLKSFQVSYQQPPASTPETAEAPGPPDFQAGSHPYQVTISEEFNTFLNSEFQLEPEGSVKDIDMQLPPGLIGNASAVPQCPMVVFDESVLLHNDCPSDTQIGVITVHSPVVTNTEPLTNLAPAPGHAAQFGAMGIAPAVVNAQLRSTGEYALTVEQHNLAQVLPITGVSVTIWGVPADPSHNPFRGECLEEETGTSKGSCSTGAPVEPLLTMPSSCAEPLTANVAVDSWEAPGAFLRQSTTAGHLSGCEQLEFDPTVTVRPESADADSPTGMAIEVGMPYNNDPSTLGSASLRDVEVALPAGISINPATAGGLGGCTPAQVGLDEEGPADCPNESRAGSFEVQSPLLSKPMRGAIYIAQPPDPFDGVLGVYLVGEADGLEIKLPGQLRARSSDGQLTFTLSDAPQLPITALNLDLSGGPRATLATPAACGVFEATAALTSYSAPESGGPVARSNSFAIDEACGGQFTPSLKAGTTSAVAGHPSAFAMELTRTDGQQYLQNFGVTLPPGLLANIVSVAHCGESEAVTGACPAASEVGTITVGDGAGPTPNYLSGHVYFTGPFRGDPYGIVIVMSAVAGPFNLGTVVVRGGIAIDLATASVSISVEPFPTILDGVPLRIKSVELTTVPGFMANPTNCAAQQVTATVGSRAGASVLLSTPFQVVGCASLAFTPTLAATTEAPASRTDGVGLKLAIAYPAETQANLGKVVVELPRQVRARLSTIQQTCNAGRFAQGPAQCPASAVVGSARVTTKILPSPLAGNIYLVSGAGLLPHLEMMLAGDGITYQLAGQFSISKHGVTTALFEGLPDVPLSSVLINLPRGPHSVLGANTDLCKHPVTVGYSFTAQAGAHLHHTTKLAVASGCSAGRAHDKRAAPRGGARKHAHGGSAVRRGR